MDAALIQKLLPKIDYNVLIQAAQQLASHCPTTVPNLPAETPTGEALENEETIRQLHRVLMDIHLVEGALVCPDTGRRFPVKEGIPNMVLHEDEI